MTYRWRADWTVFWRFRRCWRQHRHSSRRQCASAGAASASARRQTAGPADAARPRPGGSEVRGQIKGHRDEMTEVQVRSVGLSGINETTIEYIRGKASNRTSVSKCEFFILTDFERSIPISYRRSYRRLWVTFINRNSYEMRLASQTVLSYVVSLSLDGVRSWNLKWCCAALPNRDSRARNNCP